MNRLQTVESLLQDIGSEITRSVARCGSFHCTGATFASALRKSITILRNVYKCNDDMLFCEVMYDAIRDCRAASLFLTTSFSPFEPLGNQDPSLWLTCRAAFELDCGFAKSIAIILTNGFKDCIAFCGFLCSIFRTQLALELLLLKENDAAYIRPLVYSMMVVEPIQRRTLISLLLASIVGTREHFESRLCNDILEIWNQEFDNPECVDQRIVVVRDDADVRMQGQLEAVKSRRFMNCPKWMELVLTCRERLDPTSDPNIWISIFETVADILDMSQTLLCRKRIFPFIIMWLHCASGLTLFCRLIRSLISCEEIAFAVESEIKASKPKLAYINDSRHMLRLSAEVQREDTKWKFQTLDTISKSNIDYIVKAKSKVPLAFLHTQGGFRQVACASVVTLPIDL